MFRVLIILVLFGSISLWASIVGSKHDFSSQGWSQGEICLPCHTPHNAESNLDGPLWNHEVSSTTYTLYSSQYANATVPVQPEMGSITRLCLSCHDGTIALDSFGGGSGSNYIGSDGLVGTNLGDDHPVSVQWTHNSNSLTSSICTNCHDIRDPTLPYGFELKFFSGRVECATCHDPHNNTVETYMLRKTMVGSELCLHCHDK